MEKERQSQKNIVPESVKQTSLLNWKLDMEAPQVKGQVSKDLKGKGKGSNRRNRKLTQKEMKEVKRTHKNIFNWLKEPDNMEDGQERMLDIEPVEVMDREERMDRIQRKKLQWASYHMCKGLILDMMDMAAKEVAVNTCKDMMDTVMRDA